VPNNKVKDIFKMFEAALRIRDVYPGSGFLPIPNPGSRIPDLGSKKKVTKERGD
jgi:hypothetical protein